MLPISLGGPMGPTHPVWGYPIILGRAGINIPSQVRAESKLFLKDTFNASHDLQLEVKGTQRMIKVSIDCQGLLEGCLERCVFAVYASTDKMWPGHLQITLVQL